MAESADVVIFRMFQGEVVALFPDMEADSCGRVSSYGHIGQHCAASYSLLVGKSRPATKEEYIPLLAELTSIGYKLKVRRRRYRR